MAPLPPSSNPDVGPTLGALLIGTMLASIIYGITTLQLFFYFTSYSKDSIALKALVVTMWWIDLVTLFEPDAEPIVDHRILDTFDLAFIGHTLYTYFILDYLNPAELLEMVWTIASEPIIAATVALIVHQFLIYRIWALNKSFAPLAICLSIFSVFPWSLSFVSVGKFIGGGGRWDTAANLRWIAIAADVSSSALDLIIAGTTCYLFRRGSQYNVRRTGRMIMWLSVYTISSGVLTSLMSTGALIAFLSSPSSFGYQAFDFMLSKTYANAMMASLNARQSLRSIGQASGANVLSTTQPLSGGIFVGRDTDTSGDGNTTNVALGNLMLSQDDRKTATSSTSKIEGEIAVM